MTIPPIALLPGLDGTGRFFAGFQGVLPTAHAVTVVRYGPAVADHSQAEAEARAQLSHVASNPHLLIAESFSGPVAIRLAADAGEQVCGLVLVGTFARWPRGWLRPWMLPRWLASAQAMVPRSLVRWVLANGDGVPGFDAVMSTITRDVPPTVLADRLRSCWSVDVRTEARRIRIPTLILEAEQDRVIGPRAGRELKALIPGADGCHLPGPHLLLQAAPAACWDMISRWWSEQEVGPT